MKVKSRPRSAVWPEARKNAPTALTMTETAQSTVVTQTAPIRHAMTTISAPPPIYVQMAPA
jgi:hypothetical protein